MNRTKPKTPKELLEERRTKRRGFMVRSGVYFALAVGVLASQAVTLADDLTASFEAVELGQMFGSMFVAGALYSKLEGKGDMEGKKKNTMRMLRNALYHGFFWMSIIGSWW